MTDTNSTPTPPGDSASGGHTPASQQPVPLQPTQPAPYSAQGAQPYGGQQAYTGQAGQATGYGAQQPYGYGAQQAPGSAQHSAGQVYGQQTYEAEPVSMHAQHAAPKGNGGKTFLIAFAGALVACVLAFGVWGIAGAMIPGGSSSGTSSVVTDPSTGETTVIAPSEDPTLAEAVSAKCLPSVAAITVYADASQNDAMSQYFGYQYGGQSVNIKHLGKYLRKSKEKFAKQLEEEFGDTLDQAAKDKIVQMRLHDELKSGVQTIQYQINTLMTTNGQSPFVTLFLHIDENDEYVEETVQIIMEILRQRIEGTKNEKGVYVTPAFPKLVYVLDENNCLKGGKYDYVTKLAAQCSAKRMYPDYISAKKMRENYEGNVFSCMGCRSFLSPWKDENGEYKWEGRFNQGVVSINLPQIGILAKGNEEKFWKLLDERLELCYEALMCRHKALEGVVSDVSPIHWQYGAIARLKKGETIDKYLHNGYSTMSLGYIGLYETTYLMKGCSQTVEPGKEFALRVMDYMKERCAKWKEETGIAFSLYGTPAETLCYRFARIDREKYGDISNVTDKGYYTNSYHVDVREKIDAFTKFKIESEFQNKSLGGAISYVEVPNLTNNVEAIEEVIRFIYDNIQYGEFNTKSDYCHVCGYDGEIMINDNMEWECPQCHNKDHAKMNVTRRTCGYLGENFWNAGKTKEIKARVLHL